MSDAPWMDRRRPVKLKVLCFYKAWARISGSSIQWFDAIMIYVTHSGEIEEVFNWEMRRQFGKPNEWAIGGRHPKAWDLIRYLPEHGRSRFQETYSVSEAGICPQAQSVH